MSFTVFIPTIILVVFLAAGVGLWAGVKLGHSMVRAPAPVDEELLIAQGQEALYPLNAELSAWTGSAFTGYRARIAAKTVIRGLDPETAWAYFSRRKDDGNQDLRLSGPASPSGAGNPRDSAAA